VVWSFANVVRYALLFLAQGGTMPLPVDNKFFEKGKLDGYTSSHASLVRVERFFRDQRFGTFYDPPDGRYLAVLDDAPVTSDGVRRTDTVKTAANHNGYFRQFSLEHSDGSVTHGGDGAYLEVAGLCDFRQGQALYIVYAFVARDWNNDFAVLELLPQTGPQLSPILIHSIEEAAGDHSRPIENKQFWHGFHYVLPKAFKGTVRVAVINGQKRSTPTSDLKVRPSCLLLDSIDLV
jgi:hypothetical protein